MSREGEGVVDHFCLLCVKHRPAPSPSPWLVQSCLPSRSFLSRNHPAAFLISLTLGICPFLCPDNTQGLLEFFKHGLPFLSEFCLSDCGLSSSTHLLKGKPFQSQGPESWLQDCLAVSGHLSSGCRRLHLIYIPTLNSEVVNYLFKPRS